MPVATTTAHLKAAVPASKKTPVGPALSSPAVIVALGLELAGVTVLTLAAGINDDWGRLVTWFMIGLWAIYLISDARNVVSRFSTALTKVA